MIQLREPSPGLLSGSTTPLLLGAPLPYLGVSDSLILRWRGFRWGGWGSSAVGARTGVAARRKLSRLDGAADWVVGDGGEVDVAGVVVPEGSAVESPKLVAGVDGGGRGPAGESVREDQGLARS